MSAEMSESSGISFSGLLTIVFITLKLTGVISWSWWWVLAAFWVPIAFVILFVVVAALVGALA
jgi:hypothetical protein